MFASGALLGVFLDVYGVLSRRFSLRGWPISLFDLLFWIAAACFVFRVLLWSNWGEMRFYIMLAIIAGIVFYFRLLTKPVTSMLTSLLRTMEWLIKTIIRIAEVVLYRPVVFLYRLLWRMVRSIALFTWTILTKSIIWAMNPVVTFCRPHTTKLKKWWSSRKKGDDELE